MLALPPSPSDRALPAAGADAAASSPFLAHQALYDLSLVKSRGSTSINSARGRILYNFSGSACEGYTSEFRQVSELDSGEDKLTLSDLRSTSWEDGAGKSYRFKIDTRMNDTDFEPGRRRRGAHRRPHHGQAETAGGQDLHARRRARCFRPSRSSASSRPRSAGKSVLELTVYDGSDNGEKVYNTLSVIGQPIPATSASPRPIPPPPTT